MTTMFRYAAYAPNGARIGDIPVPVESSFSSPMNEVSGCTISYLPRTPGWDLLQSPVELAVEISVNNGATWIEIPNGRYMRRDREYEKITITGAYAYVLPGYAWQLNKAIQWQTTGLNEDGKRPFLSATVGVILKTLIDEAHTRGTIPGLTYSFDTALDSSGTAWDKIITIYYEPGISIYQILDNLAQQGMCDWRMQGRTLQVYNADTVMGVDLSETVRLQPGVDIKALPVKASIENLVNNALVIGDGGVTLELNNPAVVMPWGDWETSISNAGVSDTGTMTLLGTALLELGGAERVQFTCEMKMDTTSYFPFGNFGTGNYISGPSEAVGGFQAYRVRQMNGRSDKTGKFQIDLVVNDRFVEREIRNAKKTNGIVGGASAGGSGGQPTPPPGQGQDEPAQVVGLVVNSNAYIDSNGRPAGTIESSWAAVTTSSDGNAMDISGYEVAVRLPAGVWEIVAQVESTSWNGSPYDPGVTYETRVRAVGKYSSTPGIWSGTQSILIASDVTPPSIPSTPTATTRLGVITITWNGLNNVGGGMQSDFDFIEIAMGNTATPTTVIDTLRTAGSILVTGQAYGENRYFRFRSVDTSGNESNWSTASAPIATIAIVDPDLVDSTIQQAVADAQTDADAAQVSANGKSRVNYGSSAPTSSTPGRPGDVFWVRVSNTIVGQYLCTVGTDTASGNTWVAQELTNATIATLDAGKITTGFLSADRIDANTISTQKLLIASTDNMAEDPKFVTPGTTWGSNTATSVADPTGGRTGGTSLKFTGTSAQQRRFQNSAFWRQSYPLAAYRISAWVFSDQTVPAGAIELGFQTENESGGTGTQIRTTGHASFAASTWTRITGTVWVNGSTIARIRPVVGITSAIASPQNVWFDDVQMNRASDGSLVVDGAITADKIATNAITAGKIAANAVTAGTINAGAIDGMVITGAVIRTAASGGRIEFNSTEFAMYDNASTQQFSITPGSVWMTNLDVTTLNIGRGVSNFNGTKSVTFSSTATPNISGMVPGIGAGNLLLVEPMEYDNDLAAARVELAVLDSGGSLGGTNAYVLFGNRNSAGTASQLGVGGTNIDNAASIAALSQGNNTKFDTARVSMVIKSSGVAYLGDTTYSNDAGGVINLQGASGAWSATTGTGPRIAMAAKEIFITAANQTRVFSVATTSLNLVSSEALLVVNHSGGVFVAHDTTASAANTFMTTNGNLQRSSSSRRYKVGIEDLVMDPQLILTMRPRVYRDRRMWEENPHTAALIPGFVAEEFDEQGLGLFVTYHDGVPEGLSYDRISSAHQIVLKDHDARLARLESENRELRALLAR